MKFNKIYIEITNSCNLNCSFCAGNKRKLEFMSLDDFLHILDSIKEYTNYIYLHVLGEPLLHPLINEFIDLASERGFFVNITTNGYLINKIKDNKNIRQINVSLHSYSSNYNLDIKNYLDDVFNCAHIFNNNTYVSYRLWNRSDYYNDIIDYINLYYNQNIDLNQKGSIKISDNIFLDMQDSFTWPSLNNSYYSDKGKCYGGIKHIAILVDGTVVPCCLDSLGNINLGNIFTNDLNSIINSHRFCDLVNGFKNNKKIEELCKHCDFL